MAETNGSEPAMELEFRRMHLALIGVFRAKWSADVHEEWMSSLLANRPDPRAKNWNVHDSSWTRQRQTRW